MLYAVNENKDVIIADKAEKGNNYYCPCCGQNLILRKGKVVSPHFAHKSCVDCDTFTHDMSEWHRDWQSKFPENTREVHIKAKLSESDIAHLKGDIDFRDFSEEKVKYVSHRADVCFVKRHNNLISHDDKIIEAEYERDSDTYNGLVFEFQHSPISKAEFEERNEFYNACGFKVIWIFDVIDLVDDGVLYRVKKDLKSKSEMWAWDKPWRRFKDFDPQISCNTIYFQVKDADLEKDDWYLKKITWCIYDEHRDVSSYKRFYASYLPSNLKYLKLEYDLDKKCVFKI